MKEDIHMSYKEYMRKAKLAPEEGDIIEYLDIKGKLLSNVLVNAQKEIPGVGCTYDADVTAFWDEYLKLKAECGYALPFNTIMMKVLVEGLKAAPRLNAHFEYNHTATSGRLIIKKHIDVAMAICLESGETFQIKVKQLEDKSLQEMVAQIEDVKDRLSKTNIKRALFELAGQRMAGYAAKGKIGTTFAQFISAYFGKGKIAQFSRLFIKKRGKSSSPKGRYEGLRSDDFGEGTVCFTNWGTLYENLDVNITYIPPLYPQVFLFGTGRIKDVEYAFKDENGNVDIGTKKVLPLTLVFDHKIGGAADIMPFIRKLDEIFANPEIMREW